MSSEEKTKEQKTKSNLLNELKEAQEAFKKYDKDNSGKISASELKSVK